MVTTNIGDVIKECRLRLGISQEELCGNAIAVSTLSRIERNKIMPHRKTRDYLCQKLGLSEMLIPAKIEPDDVRKDELEKEIIHRSIVGTFGYDSLVEEYKKLCDKKTQSLEKQFLIYAAGVFGLWSKSDWDENMNLLIEGISITFPNFSFDNISDLHNHYFSDIEVLILRLIAYYKYMSGGKELGVDMILELQKACEEKNHTTYAYAAVLYFVNKMLNLENRWEEAYDAACKGVDFCVSHGQFYFLQELLFDKGWNLAHIGQKKEARVFMLEACAMSKVMNVPLRLYADLKQANKILGKDFEICAEDF